MSSILVVSGLTGLDFGLRAETELAAGCLDTVSAGTWKVRALAFVVFAPRGARVRGPDEL